MFCLQEKEYLGTVVVHFWTGFFFLDWIRVQKFLTHSPFISKVLLLA